MSGNTCNNGTSFPILHSVRTYHILNILSQFIPIHYIISCSHLYKPIPFPILHSIPFPILQSIHPIPNTPIYPIPNTPFYSNSLHSQYSIQFPIPFPVLHFFYLYPSHSQYMYSILSLPTDTQYNLLNHHILHFVPTITFPILYSATPPSCVVGMTMLSLSYS